VDRGNNWTTKGEWDRAIADYDFALAFDPQSHGAYYNELLSGVSREISTVPLLTLTELSG
jgi:hypothetical protein